VCSGAELGQQTKRRIVAIVGPLYFEHVVGAVVDAPAAGATTGRVDTGTQVTIGASQPQPDRSGWRSTPCFVSRSRSLQVTVSQLPMGLDGNLRQAPAV
jgi:hypothetical protein